MLQVYDYIQQQKCNLETRYPNDTSLFSLVSNILTNDDKKVLFSSDQKFSLTKMTYILDALTILRQDKYYEIFAESETDNLYTIYQKSIGDVLDISDTIPSTKILCFFSNKLNKDLSDKLINYFKTYLVNMDYLFERNASVSICDIVELLILMRKNPYSDNREITDLIIAYIEILIGQMKEVGFEQHQHSFFLEGLNHSIEAIYWHDGDIRKSIILLKEGFYNNYPKFFETGFLISQHVMLISSISKVESDKFGTNVGLLGLICGFKQLYEVTGDSIFKKESDRWTFILEKSLVRLAERNESINIKTLIDIALSFRYLNLSLWKKSENLLEN